MPPAVYHVFRERDYAVMDSQSIVQVRKKENDKLVCEYLHITPRKDGPEPLPECKDPSEVMKRYEKAEAKWRGIRGDCLSTILGQGLANQLKIDNILCFGIGSPSAYNDQAHYGNPFYQLADLVMTLKRLKSLNKVNQATPIYFDSTNLNDVDKGFLQMLMGRHLEKTIANILNFVSIWAFVKDTSFVYASGAYDDILYHAICAATTGPHLFLGNSLEHYQIDYIMEHPKEERQHPTLYVTMYMRPILCQAIYFQGNHKLNHCVFIL